MSERLKSQVVEDMERLRRRLDSVFRTEKGQAPLLAGSAESRILDIACGECHEAETLTSFLEDLRGERNGHVTFKGIDMRAREIENAARRLSLYEQDQAAPGSRSFELLTGDASRLGDHRELGGEFDLVFLRHQNYWNGRHTWESIFEHAMRQMNEEGNLVITSYFDREHELAVEAIQRLGGELIRSEFNPETRQLTTPGKSVDRHVALFRLKK